MGKTNLIIILLLFNVIFFSFITAIVIYFFQYKKKKKEYSDKIILQEEIHQKEILSTQIEIQSQTMQHIGREIHDDVGQHLTLASLYVQKIIHDNKESKLNNEFAEVSDILNTTLSKLRELSRTLIDDSVEKSSIIELIENECKKVNLSKKTDIKFITSNENIYLSYQEKNILLRVIQEFIQNSLKYSNCNLISINLSNTVDVLYLDISDNGVGFDLSNNENHGMGLINMKKRIEILEGNYSIESNSKGTKVKIEIPLTHEK